MLVAGTREPSLNTLVAPPVLCRYGCGVGGTVGAAISTAVRVGVAHGHRVEHVLLGRVVLASTVRLTVITSAKSSSKSAMTTGRSEVFPKFQCTQ